MVGILLVTHNGLGDSFINCIEHVLGEVPKNLKVLSVHASDDPQRKLLEGQELVKEMDAGAGVLILADIYGATPSNIARQLCHAERVIGVAGVSLPMLLRVVCSPATTLTELAKIAIDGGRENIVYIHPDK